LRHRVEVSWQKDKQRPFHWLHVQVAENLLLQVEKRPNSFALAAEKSKSNAMENAANLVDHTNAQSVAL
jgi:hypothetical protein